MYTLSVLDAHPQTTPTISGTSHQHSHALPVFLRATCSIKWYTQPTAKLDPLGKTNKLGGSNLTVVHLVSILDS